MIPAAFWLAHWVTSSTVCDTCKIFVITNCFTIFLAYCRSSCWFFRCVTWAGFFSGWSISGFIGCGCGCWWRCWRWLSCAGSTILWFCTIITPIDTWDWTIKRRLKSFISVPGCLQFNSEFDNICIPEMRSHVKVLEFASLTINSCRQVSVASHISDRISVANNFVHLHGPS